MPARAALRLIPAQITLSPFPYCLSSLLQQKPQEVAFIHSYSPRTCRAGGTMGSFGNYQMGERMLVLDLAGTRATLGWDSAQGGKEAWPYWSQSHPSGTPAQVG